MTMMIDAYFWSRWMENKKKIFSITIKKTDETHEKITTESIVGHNKAFLFEFHAWAFALWISIWKKRKIEFRSIPFIHYRLFSIGQISMMIAWVTYQVCVSNCVKTYGYKWHRIHYDDKINFIKMTIDNCSEKKKIHSDNKKEWIFFFFVHLRQNRWSSLLLDVKDHSFIRSFSNDKDRKINKHLENNQNNVNILCLHDPGKKQTICCCFFLLHWLNYYIHTQNKDTW